VRDCGSLRIRCYWPGLKPHSADGYRLVDALICRPAPGRFEVAQFTHQAGHQRAERAALGDRVPSATLADSPPEAAPARGDLSWLAGSEPAPAVHAPHGEARCAGRQAFNRLIKSTHRKACGYPARTLPCLRFNYFCLPQLRLTGRSTVRSKTLSSIALLGSAGSR